MFFPTDGQRSCLRAPQLLITAAKTMRSVNTFAVFMMYKFDYKVNKNLANLLPVIDEVYVKSVISNDQPTKINKNKQKLQQKHPGVKLTKFDDTLRKEWGEWYIPMKTFLNGMEKFKKKLPHFHASQAVGFGVPLEQSTSELVARWKAHHFPAKTLVSLTGGLGVDDWAWAETGCKVSSFDTNETLNFWSTLNFDRLGVFDQIDRYAESAEWALENWTQWQQQVAVDIIYIDPDRRPQAATGARVIADVNQYSPNIFALYKQYKTLSSTWLIKLSPMVDIHWFQSQIGCPLRAFSVCSGKEVKEILVQLPGSADLQQEELIKKEMVGLSPEHSNYFSSFLSTIKQNEEVLSEESKNYDPLHQYMFEPHSGLFALGLNRILDEVPGLTATGNYSFFRSNQPLPKWLGRTLRIEFQCKGSLREISRQLHENKLTHITITARNCGMNTAELIKQLGTKENHAKHGFIYKENKEFTIFVGVI